MQQEQGKQMFVAWVHLPKSLQPVRVVLDESGMIGGGCGRQKKRKGDKKNRGRKRGRIES